MLEFGHLTYEASDDNLDTQIKVAPIKFILFFWFFNENTCCGYFLEVPRQATSNEYPQHILSKNENFTWYYTNLYIFAFIIETLAVH